MFFLVPSNHGEKGTNSKRNAMPFSPSVAHQIPTPPQLSTNTPSVSACIANKALCLVAPRRGLFQITEPEKSVVLPF